MSFVYIRVKFNNEIFKKIKCKNFYIKIKNCLFCNYEVVFKNINFNLQFIAIILKCMRENSIKSLLKQSTICSSTIAFSK